MLTVVWTMITTNIQQLTYLWVTYYIVRKLNHFVRIFNAVRRNVAVLDHLGRPLNEAFVEDHDVSSDTTSEDSVDGIDTIDTIEDAVEDEDENRRIGECRSLLQDMLNELEARDEFTDGGHRESRDDCHKECIDKCHKESTDNRPVESTESSHDRTDSVTGVLEETGQSEAITEVVEEARRCDMPESNEASVTAVVPVSKTNRRPVFRDPEVRTYQYHPIVFHDLEELYQRQLHAHWTPADVFKFDPQLEQWHSLSDEARHLFTSILLFFLTIDELVAESLPDIGKHLNCPEAQRFLAAQIAIEWVHAEVYSNLVRNIFPNDEERNRLIKQFTQMPELRKKFEFLRNMFSNPDSTLGDLIVAWACTENIFLTGSFYLILWLAKRGLLKQITLANELISRDENMHCEFACTIFRNYLGDQRPSNERVYEIVKEVVAIDEEFFAFAFKNGPVDVLNRESTMDYVRACANSMLDNMGVPILYEGIKIENFEHVNTMSCDRVSNFFETPSTEYQKISMRPDEPPIAFVANEQNGDSETTAYDKYLDLNYDDF